MSANPILRPLAGVALRAQPDSELVDLFRQGHDRAYEEIVRRYRAALVAFAGAIVPKHRAEDVVQESLLRAHGALAGDNEIDVRPWLYTIVRNRALNSIRDERVHEHLSEEFDGVPQPPEVLARRAELSELVAGLKALPDAQRKALVRREMEGRSHEEIAAELGATPGAVRGLIFRARGALRNLSGLLIPPSVVQTALSAPAGGAVAGAAGLAAGGGSGLLVKAGIAATAGVLAVGGGVAIHKQSASSPPAETHSARQSENGDSSAGVTAAPSRPATPTAAQDAAQGSERASEDLRGSESGPGGSFAAAGGSRQGSSGPGSGSGGTGSMGDASSGGSSEGQAAEPQVGEGGRGPNGDSGREGRHSSTAGAGPSGRDGSQGSPGPGGGRDGGEQGTDGGQSGQVPSGNQGPPIGGSPAGGTGSGSGHDGSGPGGSDGGGPDGGGSGSGDSGSGSGSDGGSGDGGPLDGLPTPGTQ